MIKLKKLIKEELEAFLLGVEEGHGWLDYNANVHTKGKDQKFTLEEFGLDVEIFSHMLEEWEEYMENPNECYSYMGRIYGEPK